MLAETTLPEGVDHGGPLAVEAMATAVGFAPACRLSHLGSPVASRGSWLVGGGRGRRGEGGPIASRGGMPESPPLVGEARRAAPKGDPVVGVSTG